MTTSSETYVKCNLCGADDFDVLFEAGKAQVHRIVRCRRCDLMYANPQRDNVSELEQIHLADGSADAESDSRLHREMDLFLKKQFLQLRDYAPILDFADRKATKGVLVEVGSYAGVFLNEARKRGWDVIGIEPLEIPALYAEKNFGIRTIRRYFGQASARVEEADLEPSSADVIVSSHAIEHVPDPTAFVKKAHEVLKPDGYLVLETPSYDSLPFKLLGHRERSIRCDSHIYVFTKATLAKLVESCGFRVLKHDKVGRSLTVGRLLMNLGIITGKRDLFARIGEKVRLDERVITINLGDMQRIYCAKAS
jgi:2-polyprenyl-3-methyl-5-hydroxy-6-metoxy-1,4-benzoquinol methylase